MFRNIIKKLISIFRKKECSLKDVRVMTALSRSHPDNSEMNKKIEENLRRP